MKFRVNFFDKNSDETRSFYVHANDKQEAEDIADKEADRRGYPKSFKIADVELIDYP